MQFKYFHSAKCADAGRQVIVASIALAVLGCGQRVESTRSNGQYVDTYDAGKVFLDPPTNDTKRVSHVFEVKGPPSGIGGAFKLESSSCGCTTCEFLDPLVAADKTAKVKLSYNVRYERRRRVEGVVLSFAGHAESRLLLRLAVDVFPRILPDPYLMSTVSLTPGVAQTKGLRVICYAPQDEPVKPFQIDMACPGAKVAMVSEPLVEISDGVRKETRSVRLRFDPSDTDISPSKMKSLIAGHELVDGIMRIRSGAYELEIPLTWRHASDIHMSPESPLINARAEQHSPLCLVLTAEREFAIASTESEQDIIQIDCAQNKMLKRHILELRLGQIDKSAEAFSNKVTIHTNYPRNETLVVPVDILW